jgi:hypothetical protein
MMVKALRFRASRNGSSRTLAEIVQGRVSKYSMRAAGLDKGLRGAEEVGLGLGGYVEAAFWALDPSA